MLTFEIESTALNSIRDALQHWMMDRVRPGVLRQLRQVSLAGTLLPHAEGAYVVSAGVPGWEICAQKRIGQGGQGGGDVRSSTGDVKVPWRWHSAGAGEEKSKRGGKEQGTVFQLLDRAVLHRIAESTGRTVDIAYASIVHQLGITQRFFQEGGFGNLDVVNFHEDVGLFDEWPPAHFDDVPIDWRRRRKHGLLASAILPSGGKEFYSVIQGSFETPCRGSAYDALPIESRTAHALWVMPKHPAPGNPTVLHLAATGDHGFSRREALAIPLAMKGVGSVVLESPFYGLRKPEYQQGAKLRYVSDLLLLGRATIEESLLLLNWMKKHADVEKLGVSGLSMGGVHSCMVASLYPDDVALIPLLAPRSAAAAYCSGALFHATGWKKLIDDIKERQDELRLAVEKASRPSLRVAAARGLGNSRVAVDVPATSSINSSVAVDTANKEISLISWIQSWSEGFQKQMETLATNKAAHGSREEFMSSVALLEAVLETYTDVTRFPVPKRPDASIIVAATEDAYVSRESVLEMHEYLPGSELRWVPGGHVSSFVLHQREFRRAIEDSILHRL